MESEKVSRLPQLLVPSAMSNSSAVSDSNDMELSGSSSSSSSSTLQAVRAARKEARRQAKESAAQKRALKKIKLSEEIKENGDEKAKKKKEKKKKVDEKLARMQPLVDYRRPKLRTPKYSEECICGYHANERILVVGDGDLSFSLALLEHLRDDPRHSHERSSPPGSSSASAAAPSSATAGLLAPFPACGSMPLHLLASTYDDESTLIKRHKNAAMHCHALRSAGALVIAGVDARALHTTLRVKIEEQMKKVEKVQPEEDDTEAKEEQPTKRAKTSAAPPEIPLQFDHIIFNFPHAGGKSHIERNRLLLGGFLSSAASLLSLPSRRSTSAASSLTSSSSSLNPSHWYCGGQIHLALCQGQSGVPCDSELREFGNHWHSIQNAAGAGLLLEEVYAFAPLVESCFGRYKTSGHRERDQGFHWQRSLQHVFTKAHDPLTNPSESLAPVLSSPPPLLPETSLASIQPEISACLFPPLPPTSSSSALPPPELSLYFSNCPLSNPFHPLAVTARILKNFFGCELIEPKEKILNIEEIRRIVIENAPQPTESPFSQLDPLFHATAARAVRPHLYSQLFPLLTSSPRSFLIVGDVYRLSFPCISLLSLPCSTALTFVEGTTSPSMASLPNVVIFQKRSRKTEKFIKKMEEGSDGKAEVKTRRDGEEGEEGKNTEGEGKMRRMQLQLEEVRPFFEFGFPVFHQTTFVQMFDTTHTSANALNSAKQLVSTLVSGAFQVEITEADFVALPAPIIVHSAPSSSTSSALPSWTITYRQEVQLRLPMFSLSFRLFRLGFLQRLDGSSTDGACVGLVIDAVLEPLAMLLFGIHDIRLLWSQDPRFTEQFTPLYAQTFSESSTVVVSSSSSAPAVTSSAESSTSSSTTASASVLSSESLPDSAVVFGERIRRFRPFSLYPPLLIRDNSFYLPPSITSSSLQSTLFLRYVLYTCSNSLFHLSLLEEYHHPQRGCALNFRFLYHSADGAVHQLQVRRIQAELFLRLYYSGCIQLRYQDQMGADKTEATTGSAVPAGNGVAQYNEPTSREADFVAMEGDGNGSASENDDDNEDDGGEQDTTS